MLVVSTIEVVNLGFVVWVPEVCVFLVFTTAGLAVRTIPVDQDDEGENEEKVGDQY